MTFCKIVNVYLKWMVMYRFLVENGKITKTWRRDRPSAIGDIVFGPQFQELLEEVGGGGLR